MGNALLIICLLLLCMAAGAGGTKLVISYIHWYARRLLPLRVLWVGLIGACAIIWLIQPRVKVAPGALWIELYMSFIGILLACRVD